MTDEDLIESAPGPQSALQLWARRLLARPAVVTALVVSGLIASSLTGYALGRNNPETLAGIYGYSRGWEAFTPDSAFAGSPFDPTYRPTPIPSLTVEDLAALGENVSRQFTVLSGQSAIPVLCGASLGQAGTSDTAYPSTVFRVDGGKITQLVWPHADVLAASGTLRTLVFQAQQCPGVPNSDATIVTGGVQAGIGDEYAVFYRRPTVSGPTVFFATVALVRVGADLIEVSFTSDIIDIPDAEARCLRAATAAVGAAAGN